VGGGGNWIAALAVIRVANKGKRKIVRVGYARYGGKPRLTPAWKPRGGAPELPKRKAWPRWSGGEWNLKWKPIKTD